MWQSRSDSFSAIAGERCWRSPHRQALDKCPGSVTLRPTTFLPSNAKPEASLSNLQSKCRRRIRHPRRTQALDNHTITKRYKAAAAGRLPLYSSLPCSAHFEDLMRRLNLGRMQCGVWCSPEGQEPRSGYAIIAAGGNHFPLIHRRT